jgi:DNA-binding PadR family transcriptional regulator
MLWHVILGLLREGRLHHGYELMTAYRVRSGTPASPGNFYRELARLGTHGYVETGVNPPHVDARRIPYHITERGRGAFDRWLESPPLSEGELSGWLLFSGRLSAADRERVLDSWEEQLWLRSQELSRQHREVTEQARAARPAAEYQSLRVLLSRQLKHVAADLAFLEELRSDIELWLAQRGDAVGAAAAVSPSVTRGRDGQPELRRARS